jgi:hypothetical protein
VHYRTRDTTHEAEVHGENLFEVVASAASLFRNGGPEIRPNQVFHVEMADSGALHFVTLQQVEAFGLGISSTGVRMQRRKGRVQCLLSGKSCHPEQSDGDQDVSTEETKRALTLVLEKTLGGYRACCLNHPDRHDSAVELRTDHQVVDWLEFEGVHRAQSIRAIGKCLADGRAVISIAHRRK